MAGFSGAVFGPILTAGTPAEFSGGFGVMGSLASRTLASRRPSKRWGGVAGKTPHFQAWTTNMQRKNIRATIPKLAHVQQRVFLHTFAYVCIFD